MCFPRLTSSRISRITSDAQRCIGVDDYEAYIAMSLKEPMQRCRNILELPPEVQCMIFDYFLESTVTTDTISYRSATDQAAVSIARTCKCWFWLMASLFEPNVYWTPRRFDLGATTVKTRDQWLEEDQNRCERYVSPEQKRVKQLEKELAESEAEKAQMKRALVMNKIEWWTY